MQLSDQRDIKAPPATVWAAILDPDMLKDAQKHPQDYRHLLVRVTGYNAYFTTIGRELQDEVIARVSHGRF